VPFKIDHTYVDAFVELKKRLVCAPVLRFPDFSRTFVLHCDASGVGVGVVLAQRDDDGREYAVAYASRTLKAAERKYSTTEKECLAVVYGVGRFRMYLLGSRFEIITDHRSLRWLMSIGDDANARLQCWALKLSPYDFDIQYCPGINHGNAWSVYFNDPEGNTIEVYRDSPFHVPQPHGEPLDLTLSDGEILAQTEQACRRDTGFMMREDWQRHMSRRLDGGSDA